MPEETALQETAELDSAYRTRLAFLLVFLLMALGTACRVATQSTTDNSQAEGVRAVMESQQTAWNRGDIDGFMDGYERADSTTFISGDEFTRGWQTVLDRYKRRYSSPEQMGKLAFSELQIQPVGASHVLVDGRWQLTLADGNTPHGRFTLLFHQTDRGWRITHDTTTAAQ